MKLNRGINLGGYLSQCRHTKEHYESFIKAEDLKIISDAGFDHVRLPVDHNVWEFVDGSENEYGYSLTDRAVSWCKDAGLNVILDLHKAKGYDFNDANNAEKNNLFTNKELQERFITLWGRTAKRYGKCENVAFELLNEVVEESNVDAWNSLIARTVSKIREYAPTTTVIYGGIQWNNVEKIKYLEKPADENIMFTFHYYSPMPFTHQRAPWVPTIDQNATAYYPDEASGATIDYPRTVIKDGVEAAKRYGVKLYCGEFGVIDQAPVEDTLRWYKDTVKVFEEYDIACSPWTYKWMSFGLWDEHYAPIRKDLIKVLTGKNI